MMQLVARKELMISQHLLARGIREPRVIAAMREIPREEFVPPEFMEYAYDDNPLPLAEGQTISQPYIVAYMAEALELSPADRVLEVGTGSGYSAAVLSRIAAEVHSIEHLAGLASSAAERLNRLGYSNVYLHQGDGTLGWPGCAPYDAIVVTAGAPEVPQPLLEQLANGGRIVIPVGPSLTFQTLIRVRRLDANEYRREYLTDVRFVPLLGAFGWKD